jgi:hypothetical protein
MVRQIVSGDASRPETRVNGRGYAAPHHIRRGGWISTRHQLLSDWWTAEVEALEVAIGRFRTDPTLTNNCDVVFFEIAGDRHLHVNVTHRYPTKPVRGWAGPGEMPDGFVHNRRFGDRSRAEMMRHVRDIVFAHPA